VAVLQKKKTARKIQTFFHIKKRGVDYTRSFKTRELEFQLSWNYCGFNGHFYLAKTVDQYRMFVC